MIGYIVSHLYLYDVYYHIDKNECSIISRYKQLILKHFWTYHLRQNYALYCDLCYYDGLSWQVDLFKFFIFS